MKRNICLVCALLLVLSSCTAPETPVPTVETTVATAATTAPPAVTTTCLETEPTLPPIVLEISEEEQTLLMKLAMSEVGKDGCVYCLALVMCTALNRVKDSRFGSSICSVIYAKDQFTPVMDGSFEKAKPNALCRDALDLVLRGWDESEGALYYEFCTGPSWHSQNLTQLFSHCNTRFYTDLY